jgi:hypothetical protein
MTGTVGTSEADDISDSKKLGRRGGRVRVSLAGTGFSRGSKGSVERWHPIDLVAQAVVLGAAKFGAFHPTFGTSHGAFFKAADSGSKRASMQPKKFAKWGSVIR